MSTHPHLKTILSVPTVEIAEAGATVDTCTKAKIVKDANIKLLQVSTTADVVNEFRKWDARRSKHAMFKPLMNYLHRVEMILFFAVASQNANFGLHL